MPFNLASSFLERTNQTDSGLSDSISTLADAIASLAQGPLGLLGDRVGVLGQQVTSIVNPADPASAETKNAAAGTTQDQILGCLADMPPNVSSHAGDSAGRIGDHTQPTSGLFGKFSVQSMLDAQRHAGGNRTGQINHGGKTEPLSAGQGPAGRVPNDGSSSFTSLSGLGEKMQKEAASQNTDRQQLAAQQEANAHLGALAGCAGGSAMRVQVVGAQPGQW